MSRLLIFLTTLIAFGCANNSKTSQKKFRIPAEWEEQEAVWFGWEEYHTDYYPVVANVVNTIKDRVKVKFAFNTDSLRQLGFYTLDSLGVDTTTIEAHVIQGDRFWIRDHGAIFAFDSTQELSVIDFKYRRGQLWYDFLAARYGENELYKSWYDSTTALTAKVDSLMGVVTKAKNFKIDVFLEGGAFEHNGNGVLIQTEAVTLGRNPNKTKAEIEAAYKPFGIEKVIWLPQGVVEDELIMQLYADQYIVGGTGGHTDEYVRFADENTILLAWVDEDEIDEHPLNQENYKRMSKNFKILQEATDVHGKPFNIIKMPIPRPIETPFEVVEEFHPDNFDNDKVDPKMFLSKPSISIGDTLFGVSASSYLNFLITNGAIVGAGYAQYGSPDKDEEALMLLQKAFPDREIFLLDAKAINFKIGGGGIHCSTMQQPKTRL